jgi:hypothetical protein
MRTKLLMAIGLAAVAQSASAGPIGWEYQAMPLTLTHPEFFGGGEQQQSGAADGGWQGQPGSGQQGSDGQNGHGSLLSDDLSRSGLDDRGTQSGGQNYGQNGSSQHISTGPTDGDQNGPGQHTPTGQTDDNLVGISQGGEDLSWLSGDPAVDIADIGVVQSGAAPIAEPASLALVLSALFGAAVASRRDPYPARRYCTASSRRTR